MTTNGADEFLGGLAIPFVAADRLWTDLKKAGDLSRARAVLERLRKENGKHLLDGLPKDRITLDKLCQQHALLTSKDHELGRAVRHKRAIGILRERFDLDSPDLDRDAETMGIAGGIFKRQWEDLRQYDDLRQAARFYSRAAGPDLGKDAYPHINAAFLEDVLASQNDNPSERHRMAATLRERIVNELRVIPGDWFNAASRAEALFGLGRYKEAANVLNTTERPAVWELQTTTRQFATLAHLKDRRPLQNAEIRAVLEALLPGAAQAVRSAFVDKVGLALSGGGFRASFYHLGVLARLAELNVLRHVDVLSCVSGGSIIGACYWLALRRRLLDRTPMDRKDYIDLVSDLISRFEEAVSGNVRAQVQPGRIKLLFRMLFRNQFGAMSPEQTANPLEEKFLKPLCSRDGTGDAPIFMDELTFTPGDHDATLTGSPTFDLGKLNWLRAHKVPSMVLNATTVNTGRGWQFTPTWMGESPWAMNEDTDYVERLEWAWYDKKMIGVFVLPEPLPLRQPYPGFSRRSNSGPSTAASVCSWLMGVFSIIRASSRFWQTTAMYCWSVTLPDNSPFSHSPIRASGGC